MTPTKKNRFIRQIMSEVRQANPYEAVHTFLGRYRECGNSLEQLAGSLGVRGITVTQMEFDGGVFEEPSGLHVRLNSDSSPKRRRFTLAHEIAHLVIDRDSGRTARRSHACTELERACDILAAELLMPLNELTQTALSQTAANLLTIADSFQVSPHAAAVRLNQLGLWGGSIGQWCWDGTARELWFVGRRLWPDKTVRRRAFEHAGSRGSDYSGWEWIEGRGESEGFPAYLDVRKLGRDKVYLLAVLRKASANELSSLRGRNFAEVNG